MLNLYNLSSQNLYELEEVLRSFKFLQTLRNINVNRNKLSSHRQKSSKELGLTEWCLIIPFPFR